jgi:hypothetical protein
MLLFPFGTSLLVSLSFSIINTEGVMELGGNVQAQLNDYIDVHESVYITLMTVSVQKKYI